MKKILFSLAVMAAAAVAIVAVNAENRLDKQFEANLEALASIESNPGTSHECYKRIVSDPLQQVFYCGTCSWISGRKTAASGKGIC